MLKRKIENRIESWKATKTNQGLSSLALARRVKQAASRRSGRERYEAMVKIDFVEQPRAVEVISEAQNPQRSHHAHHRACRTASRPREHSAVLRRGPTVRRRHYLDALSAEDDRLTSSTLARCSASRLRLSIPCPSGPSTSRKCSRSTSKSSAGPREPTQRSGMP